AVGLPRADDVGKAKSQSVHVEHVAISTDESFAGELAGAVGGNGPQGTVSFHDWLGAGVAIDSAAGRVKEPGNPVLPHGFQHVLRQVGAFPKIDVRLADGASD